MIIHVEDCEADQLLFTQAMSIAFPKANYMAIPGASNCLKLLYPDPVTGQRAVSPDLLLLDINLPGLNAFEILKELQTDSGLLALPKIIISTSSAQEDIDEAYRLGANGYIVKPLNHDTLQERLILFAAYWSSVLEFPSRP